MLRELGEKNIRSNRLTKTNIYFRPAFFFFRFTGKVLESTFSLCLQKVGWLVVWLGGDSLSLNFVKLKHLSFTDDDDEPAASGAGAAPAAAAGAAADSGLKKRPKMTQFKDFSSW